MAIAMISLCREGGVGGAIVCAATPFAKTSQEKSAHAIERVMKRHTIVFAVGMSASIKSAVVQINLPKNRTP